MPDPLPTESSSCIQFTECVQRYTNEIYALSSMLLQQTAEAEKITISTFHELHNVHSPHNCDPLRFSIEAYRTCIEQCADSYAHRSILSAKEALPWEEQLIKYCGTASSCL